MLTCQFCSRIAKNTNSHKQHELRCPDNPNRQYKNGMLGKKGSNQYLKARSEGKEFHLSDQARRNISSSLKGRKLTVETKRKLSERATARIKHSPYSKHFEYKGHILESSYEYICALVLDSLNVRWTKVRYGFDWCDGPQIKKYIPDFYLPDHDLYLDPKNDYLIVKDDLKIKSAMELNKINVIVLSEEQLTVEYIRGILQELGREGGCSPGAYTSLGS